MEKHRPDDETFKRILENAPDFEPSKLDIDDMHKRLDEAEGTKQKDRGGLWWLPLFLAPFVFGMGFLFYQNQQLNEKINTLDLQLNSVKKDATLNQQTTYRFDTIYNITYIDTIITRQFYIDEKRDLRERNALALNYPSDNFRAFAFNWPTAFLQTPKNHSFHPRSSSRLHRAYNTESQLDHLFNHPDISTLGQVEEPANLLSRKMTYEAILVPSLFHLLAVKPFELSENDTIQKVEEEKKRKRSPFHYLSPKGFSIGLNSSPFVMADLTGSGTFKGALSYGISGEIEFNKRFRMMIGISKMDINFEEKEATAMAAFPSIVPNDPTDVVRELNVGLSHLHVPIGFKYLFTSEKAFTPFFTLGFIASRSIRQDFEYSFIDNTLSEYSLSQSFSDGLFSIKNLETSVGMEYGIGKKLLASARVIYIHDFELNTGEYFLLRSLGLNIGLQYKL